MQFKRIRVYSTHIYLLVLVGWRVAGELAVGARLGVDLLDRLATAANHQAGLQEDKTDKKLNRSMFHEWFMMRRPKKPITITLPRAPLQVQSQ